jgi:hypothetical protein
MFNRYSDGPGPLDEQDCEAIRTQRQDMRDPYLRAYLEGAEKETDQ